MDNIVIRYGVSDADFREKKELKKIKECKLSDFIKLDKKNLLPFEQKLQESLIELYKLNGKEPPLYKKFPLSPSRKRLVIDCTTTGRLSRVLAEKEFIAHYDSEAHVVGFDSLEEKMDTSTFIITLAHELKHAEQYTTELKTMLKRGNNYQKQQLSFISEAQAYLFGTLVEEKLGIEPPSPFLQAYRKLLERTEGNENEAQAALFRDILRKLPYDNTYKIEYDRLCPISPKDRGIARLPKSLESYATRTYGLLFMLANWFVPKESTTPESVLVTFIQQKKYKEAVDVIEQYPDLCFTREGRTIIVSRLMKENDFELMDRLMTVSVKQSQKKESERGESSRFSSSPAFFAFLRWNADIDHEMPKKEQQRLLPMTKILLKHLMAENHDDSTLRAFLEKQKALTNTELVSGLLAWRDPENKPYISDKIRAELGLNKTRTLDLKRIPKKGSKE